MTSQSLFQHCDSVTTQSQSPPACFSSSQLFAGLQLTARKKHPSICKETSLVGMQNSPAMKYFYKYLFIFFQLLPQLYYDASC